MNKTIQGHLMKAAKLAKSDEEKDVLALEELKERTGPEIGEYFAANEDEFVNVVARAALNAAWADAVKTDIINNVIETKTISSTQPYDVVEEDLRGLTARWQGVGGEIHSDPIREASFKFGPEEIVFAHDYHVKDLETDFWGTYGKIVAHGRNKMDGAPVARLLQLVNDSVNNTTNSTQYLTTAKAGVVEATIDALVDPISEKSNGRVTILGSRTALAPFGPLSTKYSDQLSDQFYRTGVIGVYKGINLVQVNNYEDEFGRLVLPDNELWIVGENAGRLTWFGSNVRVQTQILPSFHRRLEVAREAGMRLWGGDRGRLGRIVWT